MRTTKCRAHRLQGSIHKAIGIQVIETSFSECYSSDNYLPNTILCLWRFDLRPNCIYGRQPVTAKRSKIKIQPWTPNSENQNMTWWPPTLPHRLNIATWTSVADYYENYLYHLTTPVYTLQHVISSSRAYLAQIMNSRLEEDSNGRHEIAHKRMGFGDRSTFITICKNLMRKLNSQNGQVVIQDWTWLYFSEVARHALGTRHRPRRSAMPHEVREDIWRNKHFNIDSCSMNSKKDHDDRHDQRNPPETITPTGSAVHHSTIGTKPNDIAWLTPAVTYLL